jgi:ABC-type transport system involved in cytochrome bd biosynthesis fused ATPase/permease subunit
MSDNTKPAFWPVAVSVLLGLLSASVAIFSLAYQIRQQNELEQKRVEATYLTKALDVVHAPSDLLMKLAIDNHEFKNRLKVSQDKLSNYEAERVFNESFQRNTTAYSDAMMNASYFAEMIEPESSQRKNGKNELFDAILRAQDASVALYQITPDAISERIPIADLSKHPLYVQADVAGREAAKAIVRRLQELYGRPH